MATTIPEAGRRIALDEIRVPENVRALDDAHVRALAGSIKLQGILVPLVVRDRADGFELVAGFHRIAAARSLGLADVPVVVRDAETEDADRAVENTSCRRRHDVITPLQQPGAIAPHITTRPTRLPSSSRHHRPPVRADAPTLGS